MSGKPGCARALWDKLRTKYLPSETILQQYGQWERPDEAQARENYRKNHAHHDVYDIYTPIKSLKEFGDGIHMYFYMLKHTAIVFAVLAFMPGLLLVVFNGIGGWYDKADLERTMLGNFGLLTYDGTSTSLNITSGAFTKRSVSVEGAVTALFASTVTGTPTHVGGMDKRNLLVAMSALDLVGVLIYFGYSIYMIWVVRSRSRVANAASCTTTITDYSVRVGRLPPDTSAAALKEYLQAAGGEGTEVVQLELCRKVDALLGLVVERGEVVPQLDLALAVLQRKAEVLPQVDEDRVVDLLFNRLLLADVTEAIHQEQAAAKSNEVVTAFVTFNTADDRRRVLQALPRSVVRRWRMLPDRRFNNGGIGKTGKKPVALDVNPAPEPSDVQYENLEYTTTDRFARMVFTNAAKYFVLLVGFLLVSLAPAMRMGVAASGSGPSRSTCDANCSYKDATGNYVLTDTNRELYKGCDSEAGTGTLPNKLDCEGLAVCYECFCRAALTAGVYGEVLYCERFGSVVAIATVAQICAVVGIVIANAMIQFAIGWLVRAERHHTRSRTAVGTVRGLFITQFVNTAFSNLVANMYLPGPAGVIAHSFLNGYMFSGSYADTTPNWYRDVCRPIMISIFVTTLLVNFQIAFRWWWRRRRIANRYQCLTQQQMDDAYSGHDFNLSVKYGQHLYIIFVVMTYSAAMPLVYILAALHFTICYWAEKYELLKICRRPLSYSRDLGVYVTSTLPFAALWHLALGLWLFGLFGTPKSPLFSTAFRRSLESSVKAFKGLMPVASSLTPQLVAWRFTQNSSGHLFIAFMACGGALFIFFTLSTWMAVSRWLLSILGLARDAAVAAEDGDQARTATMPEFGVAVRSQLLLGPATYAVQQNPAYAHAFVRMEELEWEKREEMHAKAAEAATAAAAAAEQKGAYERQSRRQRTAANRLRAKQHAAKAAASGGLEVNDAAAFVSATNGTGDSGGLGAKGNQVAPEPFVANRGSFNNSGSDGNGYGKSDSSALPVPPWKQSQSQSAGGGGPAAGQAASQVAPDGRAPSSLLQGPAAAVQSGPSQARLPAEVLDLTEVDSVPAPRPQGPAPVEPRTASAFGGMPGRPPSAGAGAPTGIAAGVAAGPDAQRSAASTTATASAMVSAGPTEPGWLQGNQQLPLPQQQASPQLQTWAPLMLSQPQPVAPGPRKWADLNTGS